MSNSTPRALFAISSLGLGHATRSLVVLREYLQRGYRITVVSTGDALAFLRREIGAEAAVDFREMADYPALERGTGWWLYWYLLIDLLRTWRLIRQEHRVIEKIAGDYDFIFSDGRYGIRSRWVPSFILTHQIAFIPPKGLRKWLRLTERVNLLALRKFDCILIPDYPDPEHNLSGQLAHAPGLDRCNHRFVGILSSYRQLGMAQDIDYLFVISGYLIEHKDAFIRRLLDQAATLPGRKVFILGMPDNGGEHYEQYRRADLEIHAMASGRERQELFNRARCVISRAGYTTVMDLVEHGKQALLIPTPNQTEQEYLGEYLARRDSFVTQEQRSDLDLAATLSGASRTTAFDPPWRTAESLEKITESLDRLLRRHFISIIVPAHNEEAELAATLRSLLNQRYPHDRYEILVVENGSSDATLRIAREIAAEPAVAGRVTVWQSARGVSIARNLGLTKVSGQSEWVVFCDADTHLAPHFLCHLNLWLNRHGRDFAVGTCRIRPRPEQRLYARAWFRAYDLIHQITRTSYALQIARTAVARQVGFHEELHLAEDLLFLKECRRHGRFFFLPTDQVSTSTRRFDATGYLRLSLRWMVEALLPMRLKRQRKYHVIR